MGKKKKQNTRPVKFSEMVENQVYIYKRHGQGKIFKKENETLYFLDREDEKGYSWCPTLVDISSAKFIPCYLQIEDTLGILQSSGYFNDRKPS